MSVTAELAKVLQARMQLTEGSTSFRYRVGPQKQCFYLGCAVVVVVVTNQPLPPPSTSRCGDSGRDSGWLTWYLHTFSRIVWHADGQCCCCAANPQQPAPKRFRLLVGLAERRGNRLSPLSVSHTEPASIVNISQPDPTTGSLLRLPGRTCIICKYFPSQSIELLSPPSPRTSLSPL